MTLAEARFKAAVQKLVSLRIHPTPGTVNRALGKVGPDGKVQHNLNGREVGWLRDTIPPKKICPCKRGEPCQWPPESESEWPIRRSYLTIGKSY